MIKLNLDTYIFSAKPKPFPASLRTRLCNSSSIVEITPQDLISAVSEGRSFTPAVMTGTKRGTWVSQQLICCDIDNDSGTKDGNGNKIRIDKPLSVEHALKIMREYDIDPYFVYSTFSNTDEWPKFRIVLVLDKILDNPHMASDLTARFTGIFNEVVPKSADPTSKDNARIYLGGRADCIVYCGQKTTSVESLQRLPNVDSQNNEFNQVLRRASGQNNSLKYDKEHFNLAEYVLNTAGGHIHKIGETTFINPCPLCGHKDDFQVNGGLYHCFGASGGTGGSIIDYLQNKENISTKEAIRKFRVDIMGYDENRREEFSSDKKEKNSKTKKNDGVINVGDYLQHNLFEQDLSYFEDFKKRKMRLHEEIDKYLTLYPGLAVLGGASSIGKTTFIVNIIDRLIEQGEDILFFSLEQIPVEIVAKSVTARMYRKYKDGGLTNLQIKNGQTNEKLLEIKKSYDEEYQRFHIIAGSFNTTVEDISKSVELYIDGREECKPIVIIDYLQLIAPPRGHKGGTREYVDDNLKALKAMQLKNELLVVVVSSFNRSSNNEPVSYESFKESGMIESTCDYVWGLQLSILDMDNGKFYFNETSKGNKTEKPRTQKLKMIYEAQSEYPKKVEFVSLKSRNSRQFYKAFFEYFPQYDYFKAVCNDTAKISDIFGDIRRT